MQILRKYKKFIVLTFVVILGLFFYLNQNDNHLNQNNNYLNQNDNQAITDFVSSYEKFDKAIMYFTVLVCMPDNFGKNQNFLEFDSVYSQIIETFNESASADERLELAKRALLLNIKEIDNLNKSTLGTEVDDALIELNRKSTTIKNDDIRNIAVEISNIAKQETNNVISCRNVMQEKRNYINDFMQKIIDDKGELIKLLDFIKQEEDQSKTQNQDEMLAKELDNIRRDRETAYARFEGLSGLKN